MSPKSLNQKARDVREIIDRTYRKYIPRENVKRPIKTTLSSTEKEWRAGVNSYTDHMADQRMRELKDYCPDEYKRLWKKAGRSSKALRGSLRGNLLKSDMYGLDVSGFYDVTTDGIRVRSDDVSTIAHEMLHAYSTQKSGKGDLVANLRGYLPHDTMESLTEYLAQQVVSEYKRTKLGTGKRDKFGRLIEPPEAVPTSEAAYDLGKARSLIRKHGKDAVLHAFFGGWFKKKGNKYVPSKPYKVTKGLPLPNICNTGKRQNLRRSTFGPWSPGRALLSRLGQGLHPGLGLPTGPGRPSRAMNNVIRRNNLGVAPPPLTGPTYTVRRGDSLSAIAKRLTGDAGRWRELYRHNRGTIGSNPNLIRQNQVFKVPPSWQHGGTTPSLGVRRTGPTVPRGAATNPTYTVRRGDSLSAIAKRLTGDASRWRELYRHNRGIIGSNPNLIRHNQVFKVPPSWQHGGITPGLGQRRAGPTTRLGPGASTPYTVRRGDSLSAIAKRFTGDASRWHELYQHNRGIIGSNPNLIRPNQVFNIPPSWGQAPGPAHRPNLLRQLGAGLR